MGHVQLAWQVQRLRGLVAVLGCWMLTSCSLVTGFETEPELDAGDATDEAGGAVVPSAERGEHAVDASPPVTTLDAGFEREAGSDAVEPEVDGGGTAPEDGGIPETGVGSEAGSVGENDSGSGESSGDEPRGDDPPEDSSDDPTGDGPTGGGADEATGGDPPGDDPPDDDPTSDDPPGDSSDDPTGDGPTGGGADEPAGGDPPGDDPPDDDPPDSDPPGGGDRPGASDRGNSDASPGGGGHDPPGGNGNGPPTDAGTPDPAPGEDDEPEPEPGAGSTDDGILDVPDLIDLLGAAQDERADQVCVCAGSSRECTAGARARGSCLEQVLSFLAGVAEEDVGAVLECLLPAEEAYTACIERELSCWNIEGSVEGCAAAYQQAAAGCHPALQRLCRN